MMADGIEASATRLRPSATVRCAEIDGLYVVLDLRTEKYFVLNEAAGRMWATLRADGQPDGDTDSLKRYADFSADCVRRGFVVAGEGDAVAGTPRRAAKAGRFPAWDAWRSLAYTAWSLRRRGFAATYATYARLGCDSSDPAAETARREQAAAAFLAAENLLWRRRAPQDCLPRSLALYRFLRTAGVPAVHRIGGRRVPTFAMHAWVEHAGTVVLDDPRNATELTLLSSIPEA